MFPENALVAVYHDQSGALAAVRRLRESGFDMKAVSIAGRDEHNEVQVVGYCLAGDRMQYWGPLRGFWTSIWEMLSGWAFLSLPGIGPVLIAGPMSRWAMAALDNAEIFGGLSALAAALHSVGIPRDAILAHEAAVKGGQYLVIASGAAGEVSRAKEVLDPDGAGWYQPVKGSK